MCRLAPLLIGVLAVVLALLMNSCSLAADVTPPPGYTPPDTPKPLATPESIDLEQGAAIFAEKCAPCHGADGLANTEMAIQLEAQDVIVPALVSADVRQNGSLTRWYLVVTNGQGQFMPAFNSLSDQERWNVAAYALSIEPGQVTMATQQPELEPTASEAESGSETAPTEIASPMESVVPEVGTSITSTITGTVTNSLGENLSSGVEVTLYAFERTDTNPSLVFTETTTTDESGSYSFEDIELMVGQVLGTAVDYDSALYGSGVKEVTGLEDGFYLPIEVFEATTDTANLLVDHHHIIFSFDEPGMATVMEMYAVSNTGDQTIVGDGLDGTVIFFPVPDNAVNLEFQDDLTAQQMVMVPGGFADTEPIYPGEAIYQISFAYSLPFDGNQLDFDLPVNLESQVVTVLVPENIASIDGAGFEDGGSIQNMGYHRYDAYNFASGEDVSFRLSGGSGSSGFSTANLLGENRTGLAIGLGAFGVVLIAIGVWFYQRGKNADLDEYTPDGAEIVEASQPVDDDVQVETLMDAVIALDDQFRAGQLPEDAYQRRRAELKALLAEKMQ